MRCRNHDFSRPFLRVANAGASASWDRRRGGDCAKKKLNGKQIAIGRQRETER
jgi:hypothetical protein